MEILFQQKDIAERLDSLSDELTLFYRGKPLTIVVLMNGALFFASDLLRRINLPLRMDTIAVSSYQNDRSTGELVFRSRPKLSCENRHVLLIDDILDTGLTMRRMVEYYLAAHALSVRSCVLLDKILTPPASKVAAADWCGFHIPDLYVVGYGLDSNEDYRNLPYIAAMGE